MTDDRYSPVTKSDLQATYNDLLALQDQTDQVPLTTALDAVGAALRSLDVAATPQEKIAWWEEQCRLQLNSIEELGDQIKARDAQLFEMERQARNAAQASPDEMTAAALVRVAKANSSDPETDDLTIPLAIELSETQRRLYYMEEKYGKIDWGVSLPSTDGGGK